VETFSFANAALVTSAELIASQKSQDGVFGRYAAAYLAETMKNRLRRTLKNSSG